MATRPDMRCTGECCYGFTLRDENDNHIEENRVPAEMGPECAALFVPVTLPEIDDGIARFTCKAWDSETKLCTIYEKRPGICRRFPHDMTCPACGASSPEEANAPAPHDDAS